MVADSDVEGIETMSLQEAIQRFPIESAACDLKRMLKKNNELVTCIMLGKREEVNDIILLQNLNLWPVRQFHVNGSPHFCKIGDLGKQIKLRRNIFSRGMGDKNDIKTRQSVVKLE
jgi:hypothetical protein